MSRRGYGFERETELWCCKIAEQDASGDFTQRSFRTATSGAATSSKGDVRLIQVPWLEPIAFECKHLNDYSQFGPTFHLYVDWLDKIAEEATFTKSIPMLTWAFKHARTHRGEGRVQFAVPTTKLREWSILSGVTVHWESDSVKYVEKVNKYFLVYHDELWERAKDLDKAVAFILRDPTWAILSRRHLERILISIREKWKSDLVKYGVKQS